jgi:hypothetical protein
LQQAVRAERLAHSFPGSYSLRLFRKDIGKDINGLPVSDSMRQTALQTAGIIRY